MMLAHDIVGKKDEDIERQYKSIKMYWCEIYLDHTAENMDKWIQVAIIDSQYYKFIVFDKSTHKLTIIMTT